MRAYGKNSACKMLGKVKTFFELIKFEHTVFALPFAYLGMLLARRTWPGMAIFFWVTLAMAAGRTTGMTLNRIIDKSIDEKNPRTAGRAIVTGQFRVSWAWTAVVVAVSLFFLAAASLNPFCLRLSPLALILLCTYHYAKRFTWLCHFVLGAVLAMAPVGGWFAVTGFFSWPPLFLALVVLFWVAGFDVIYSLQDVEFDRSHRLHSMPVSFGQDRALEIAGYCHIATLLFLVCFGWVWRLGVVYDAGLLIVAVLLRIEHSWIADGDLSRVNAAFFTINGWIGVLLLVFSVLEIVR